MGVRKFKPTSPGTRFRMVSDFADLTPGKKPEKRLLRVLNRTGGRNAQGRLTSRHMGGGHKRRYRIIDFRRNKDGIPGVVESVEYDPNRNVRIALLSYRDGEKRYILCPRDLKVGEILLSGPKVEPKSGNCMPLGAIPMALYVHNVELSPGGGGKMVRSAGGQAQLMAKEGRYAHLLLPSGEVRKVLLECRATIGQLGNIEYSQIVIGKAGCNRWRGWRPYVRGVAQNPVSHPMGGGEGRSHGGRHPCSPWGKLAKGGKTRRRKASTNIYIVQRRKAKRG